MTQIFAHRGSKGTHPENTLPAFIEAIALGVDGIELDVQQTSDQQLVVIHDNTVDRTTNGSGEITDYTLATLKELDAGSWFGPAYEGLTIPTFDEVLDCLVTHDFKGILNIEVKTDEKDYPGIEAQVVNRLNQQEWPFTIWYSSFNVKTIETLASLDPKRPVAYILFDQPIEMHLAQEVSFLKAVHPKFTWVKNNPEEAKAYPLPLRPWTVNKTEDMVVAFVLGIAGIHTDFPKKAQKIRETYAKK